MPIFACPKCGTHLNVPDPAAGQTVGCPRCGQALIIPSAAPSGPAPQPGMPWSAPPPLPSRKSPDPAVRAGAPAAVPSLSAADARPAASIRLPTRTFTALPKPILFALVGALGALIGAILVELPFYLARPAAAEGAGKPQIDIMFVLDVTGSMKEEIEGVRDGIGQFVGELRQRDLDVRVGLTWFRDRFDQPGGILAEDPEALRFGRDVFTRDPAAFSREVDKLKALAGGDTPESALDALVYAARQPFRARAVRALLLITDAPPKIPDRDTKDIAHAIRELKGQRIDALHLIVDAGRARFEEIQRALPMQGRAFSLVAVAQGTRFDEVLSGVSREIAETTIRGVQSRQEYAESSTGRLVFAVGLWTAIIALGVSLALIVGQKLYMGQGWLDAPALFKGTAGIVAGLLGGVVAQGLFLVGQGVAWDILGRLLGWSLLGGLIGGGMALVVPNLVWWRGLTGGVMGGIVGALCFLPLSLILPELLARGFGAMVLGFCIGLMVALAEMAFRRWWLEIRYGPREIRTVTLGAVPVTVGGDERLATVVVGDIAALLLRYGLDDDRVWCEDVATGRRTPVEPGDSKRVSNVTITVCNAATRRSAGFVLKLSSGKDVPLSEGLPLTRDELPGLEARGGDGTVAIIQRRPSDPRTLLLLNRSRQPWSATERDGRERTVTPGMGIAVEPGVRVNFGVIHGRLVHE